MACRDRYVFVDVAALRGVVVELRYAGSDNLFGRPVYPVERALLRAGPARRLARAAAIIRPTGLRIKIWDAYRPLSVQKAMWDVCPDPMFVAPPWRGSKHNRGAAVDVTLVNGHGRNVLMPTDFDDFSPRAHLNFIGLPREAREHRDLLRRAMLAAGFKGIRNEWWHFEDRDWMRYPLADSPLTEF